MSNESSSAPQPTEEIGNSTQTIILAGGCFWCVEAVFRSVRGVIAITSGYAGDSAETANYHDVCSGTTNHAEAVRIEFDPRQVTLEQLLDIFMGVAHDPTQRDRQGADIGRQYRSVIFHADEEQRQAAEETLRRWEASGTFQRPIVTHLEPLEVFFPAEDYHQNYAARNPQQPYIACNVPPKLAKLNAGFADACRTE